MLPVAGGFALVYALAAAYLRNGALVGACLDVLAFAVVVIVARQKLSRGNLETAVELVACGLFGMCVVGAPLVPWLRAALVVIPLAGVALALPDLDGPRLRRISWIAFLSEVVIMSIATWRQAHVLGPPALLRNAIVVSATTISVGLTFLLLFHDANRLRRSIATADFHALQVRAAVDRVPIVIFAVDAAGKLTLSEGRGLERLGLAPGEHVGRHVFSLYADVDWFLAAVRTALSGQDASATGRFGEHVLEVHLRPMDGGGAIGVTLNVTARHQAEEALQEAIRLRDDFLSVASHELKTPLTPLRLEVGGLQRLADRGDLQGVAERTRKLLRHVTRITDLVDELLDVGRIRAGRFSLHRAPADLGAILDETLARFGSAIERSSSTIEVRRSGDATGEWDASRIEQIVSNLLTNALKYGAGEKIEIVVDGEAREVRLSVRDGGIGIAPADQERIFRRFERAASERHYPGLGLGLFIVRELVEAHGGTITVQSALGQGTTFEVVLPRGPAAIPQAHP
jgi:signal transduction histidine kinase